jgi:hypothetical protein
MMVLSCNLATFTGQGATSTPGPVQGQDATGTPAPVQGDVVPVSSPALPTPPAPLAVSLQDPEQSAHTLADALAGPDRLAAWLGLYKALGIPVIGEDRKALDGSDDPIGPGYWQVWYSAGLDLPGRGIRLSDAGRLLGFVFQLKPEDSQALGETLLSDLQTARRSQDPAVHLLGAVARERILRSGSKLDILDSATTTQTASIDIPMVQLFFWVALRGALAHVPAQSTIPQSGALLVAYDFNRVAQDAGPFNCSTALGGKDVTNWANWLILRIGGGVQLPGMDQALPGVVAMALKVGKAGAGATNAALDAVSEANILARAVSLIMQVVSMDLAALQTPDKLERTKSTTDGKPATLTWRLSSVPGKIPSGNELRQCLISLFTSILGIKLTFPKDGAIPGAEVDFEPGKNIPERVFFAKYDYRRNWTQPNGQFELLMLGRAQKKDLPDTATAVQMEYSVFASAQPEEAGLKSMANVFFSGLMFGTAPSAARGSSGLIDILKAFTYDMGEYVFPMVDWADNRYEAYASGLASEFTQKNICNLVEPFTLSGGEFVGKFTPNSSTDGNVTFTDMLGTAAHETYKGTYEVVFYDNGDGNILMQGELRTKIDGYKGEFVDQTKFEIAIRQVPDMVCPNH